MQLDTEEGETFVPPAGIVASPTSESVPSTDLPAAQDEGISDVRAAAEATREIEE